MNKIAWFLVGTCALLVALFYVVTKRNFRPDLAKNTPFFKRNFLTTVAVLAAFLSNGKIFASANESNAQIAPTSVKEEQNLGDIEKTSEWTQLKKSWFGLKETKSVPYDGISQEIELQKKTSNEHLASLVNKGYISQNVGYVLNYVYGELLFHKLRSVLGATCYKMTFLGGASANTRADLENRLKLLSDISRKGIVNEDILKEAKNNIGRDIEFLDRAQKVFNKGKNAGYDETYREEEKALANLFKNGKVDESVKSGEDAAKAAELIVRLNINDGSPQAGQKTESEQLKSFKEWDRIRINWQDVLKIGQTGYDAIEKVVAEKKKENWTLLNKLVGAGLLTGEGAGVFNDIYGDRIYHHLRPMAATCYESTMLGAKQQQVRSDLENRLNVLSDIYKKGTVKEETLKQAELNLTKDMEVVLLINELWDKVKRLQEGDNWNRYDEEQRILSYFTGKGYSEGDIKDNIKIRKGVEEAMGIIQSFYENR